MTLKVLSREAFAQELTRDGSEIDNRAIAVRAREALARWGITPKRRVRTYLREQFYAASLEAGSTIDNLFDRLIGFGDCVEVSDAEENYYAPAESRWLRTGTGIGVLLGCAALPNGVALLPGEKRDLVRRLDVGSEDALIALEAAGVREISFAEWFAAPKYLEHAKRRGSRYVDEALGDLESFWHLLVDEIRREGAPLEETSEVRVVSDQVGAFFGSSDDPPTGRWCTEVPEDGVWCGDRKGYGDVHRHPVLFMSAGDRRRVLDLYHWDEWRWALLAKGRATGCDEIVRLGGGELSFTFPLPGQLRLALDLVGVPGEKPWTWSWPEDAPDVWAEFGIPFPRESV